MSQIERKEARAPSAWGFRRGARLAGMAVAAGLWITMLVLGGAGWDFDQRLYAALYAGEDGLLGRNALLLTWIGSWKVTVPLALAAALLLVFTRRMRAALLLVMVFGGRFLVELQKLVIDRDRPGLSPHLEAVHSMSFPSGHAANALITFCGIALLLPVRQRFRAIAVGIGLAIALQVGWSRVALGVHWPSDVIGGWAFGLLWIALCMRLASDRPDADAPAR